MILEEEVENETDMREMPIAKELEKVSLNNKWVQLQFLVDQRSNTLRSHVSNVETDMAKGAKIQHDVKALDAEISNIAERLDLEKRRSIASSVASSTGQRTATSNFANENQRRNLEALDHKIWTCDNSVKQLLMDCERLVQSKFVHADQLKQRVLVLQHRINQLSGDLQEISSQIPERNIYAQLNVPALDSASSSSEDTQQDTSILAQLQSSLNWVDAQKTNLSLTSFGYDLPTIKGALQNHHSFSKEVANYRINVEQCLLLSKSYSISHRGSSEVREKGQLLENKYSSLLVRSFNRQQNGQDITGLFFRLQQEKESPS